MAMLQGIQGAGSVQEKTFGGSSFAPLPAGGYVCRIINVKVDSTPKGAVYIKFQIDVSEGEHAGYFQRRYAADKDSQYGQKWKGVYKIFLPKNNGDNDKYMNAVAYYKGQVNMLARSNSIPEPNIEMGYDPDIFKGCTIGILFREAFYQGNKFTEPAFLIEPQKIRSGDFEVPEPRTQGNTSGAGAYAMPSAQPSNGSVFTAAAFQQPAAQQSAFQTPQQNAQFQPQSAFQHPAYQTPTPAPAAPQNRVLGDLSDFEEIQTTGDVPF